MKTHIHNVRTHVAALPLLAALLALIICAAPRPALAFSDDSSGDMVVFGGQHQVIQAGQEVTGDLVVISGSAEVYGKVDGDAVALGGKIYIAPQGHVDGSLVNVGGAIDNESSTPQGHRVRPPVAPTAPPETPEPEMTQPEQATPWFAGWPTFIFMDAILVFFAFLLFPARTASATEHLVDNPVLAGMLGFFSPIIFVLVVIALAITLVGIPLIPLAVLATIGGYLIGKAAIAEFIGNRIYDISKSAQPRPVAAVAVGLAVLFVVTAFTGWIGIVFYFCQVALAIGIALYMLMRTAQAHRSRRLMDSGIGMNFPAPKAPSEVASPTDPTITGPPPSA